MPYPADFYEEKIGKFSRGPGQSLRRLTVALRASASFLHAEKGCGRAFDVLFAGLRFYARADQNTRLFRSGLMATFFLHTKKKGKDVPRGNPLEPRVILIFRAIVGHHNNGEADTRTGPYHKVAQGFEPS